MLTRFRLTLINAVLVPFLCPALTHAATASEVDGMRARALAWLHANQDADGYWSGPGGLNVQATAAALSAYRSAGIVSGPSRAAALGWLANAHPVSVEAAALRATALGLAGWNIAAMLDQLASQRNASYLAWGSYAFYQPSLPDTAIALDAYRLTGSSYANADSTLGWLINLPRNPAGGDGAFAYAGPNELSPQTRSPSRVIPTAFATMSLARWASSFNLNNQLTTAVDWLLARQLTDGGFADDPLASTGQAYETGLVLQAFKAARIAGNAAANTAAANAAVARATDFLLSGQDSTGAFANDATATGVVLAGLPDVTLVDSDGDALPDAVEPWLGRDPAIADAKALEKGGIGEGQVGVNTPAALEPAHLGAGYRVQLASSLPGQIHTVSAGRLPPGLMLDEATGSISGEPTSAGDYAFEYTVLAADGRTERRLVVLSVTSISTQQVPALPLAFLLMLSLLLLATATRTTRRHDSIGLLAFALAFSTWFLPPSANADELLPRSVIGRLVESTTDSKADVTADVQALRSELETLLQSPDPARRLEVFGEAEAARVAAVTQGVGKESAGPQSAGVAGQEEANRPAELLEQLLEELKRDITTASGAGPSAEAARERLARRLERARTAETANWHPDHPVEHLRAAPPAPARELPQSTGVPAYILAERQDGLDRAKQMYAFNGDLMMVAAPATPVEAQSCGYTAADLADDGKDVTLTPAIRELAENLGHSPARIFEYVANEVAFEPYFGAMKGAEGTRETASGSATDQSSLLIALLRASNIPARYVRGNAYFSLPQGVSEADSLVARWLQTRTLLAAATRLGRGQNPTAGANSSQISFEHVWVEACVPYAHYRGAALDARGHRWVPLDPSLETRRYTSNAASTANFDFNAYLASVSTRLPEEVYETQVESGLPSGSRLEDVGYRSSMQKSAFDILPATPPFVVLNYTNWSNSGTPETAVLPDSHRYFLHVDVLTPQAASMIAWNAPLATVLTKPLTLRFEGANSAASTALANWRRDGGTLPTGLPMQAVLALDGLQLSRGVPNVPSESVTNQVRMTVTLAEARGERTDPACPGKTGTRNVNLVCFENIGAANHHALQVWGNQGTPGVLSRLAETVVKRVNATPVLANALDDTVGRFLHLAALQYQASSSEANARIARLRGSTPDVGPHLGLTSTQSSVARVLDMPYGVNRKGFLVDMPGVLSRSVDNATGVTDFHAFVAAGYAASAHESHLWQQMARLPAVSTVSGIQHANSQGTQVLTITPANQSTELPKLRTSSNSPGDPLAYPPNFASSIIQGQYLTQGYQEVRVPVRQIDFQGWKGYVLVATKQAADGLSASFPISGGFAGGYSVPRPVTVTSFNPVTNTGYSGGSTSNVLVPPTPSSFTSAIAQVNFGNLGNGASPYNPMAGDPVNLVTGNFFHTERDISIPFRDLPVVFERAYNSRNPADGPLGFGWTHSYQQELRFLDDNANGVADAADSDGITSSIVWIDGTGAEKRFTVAGNASGVPVGSSITGPKGFTLQMSRDAAGYHIRMKDGSRLEFQTVNGQVGQRARLERMVSRNNNALTLAYDSGSGVLRTVTDSAGRALRFDYNGSRISRVTDFTGRAFEYRYDANGNLSEFHNPLALAGSQPPTRYRYYGASDSPVIDHAIREITLPKGNGMTFEYYVDGRVFRHTNALGEAYTFEYNDYRREAVVRDARGGVTRHYFNEFGNQIEIIDPTGASTKFEYQDPRDPYFRTAVVDPLRLRTAYAYDANGNVTQVTTPSGNTRVLSEFNGFNQPGKAKDARGNYTLYRYDSRGNVTDEIALVAGVGAATTASSFNPQANAAQVLAWTRHSYDAFGNRLSTERVRDVPNARGFKQLWTPDAQGLYPTRIDRCGDKDGDGFTIDDPCDSAPLSFDALGRLRSGVNGRFEAVEFQYDALGRVTAATDPLGKLRSYAFDANGNAVHEELVVDINGVPTRVDSSSSDHDAADRMRVSLDSAGFASYYGYDSDGALTSLTNPDGYTVRFTHDEAGRVLSAFDAEGREARRELDVAGRVRRQTNPNGQSRRFEYFDATQDGRLRRECDAIDRCTSFAYDTNGNVTVVTDAAGGTTLSSYDALNRVTRVAGPAYADPVHGTVRPVTVYVYDGLGRRVEMRAGWTDATGTNPTSDVVSLQSRSVHDDWGRVLSQQDALARTTRYRYNTQGDLIWLQLPNGQEISREYERGGLLKRLIVAPRYEQILRSTTLPNGQTASHLEAVLREAGFEHTFSHDPIGRLVSATTPDGTYTYAYDGAHRLVRVTDSRGAWLEYDWSPGGLLDTLRDSAGRETDYLYDPTGRLRAVWAPEGEWFDFAFDDGGRLTRLGSPGGVVGEYRYFADDRLQSHTLKRAASTFASESYTYDNLGRRQSRSRTLNGVSRTEGFGYDALSRLTSITVGAATERFSYDAFGNRVSRTPATGAAEHYTHDAAHQLTHLRSGSGSGALTGRFFHDANGNLTRSCTGAGVVELAGGSDCSGPQVLSLGYDGLDRQTSASRTGVANERYAYDHAGRRIEKVAGGALTQYHYDGAAIHQSFAGGNWQTPSTRTVHGLALDTPLLHHAAGQRLTFHQDVLGSVIATTDAATGQVRATQGFDAFGNLEAGLTTSARVPTYGYTGREPDATGLTYFRARYYQPSLGRFTQADPAGFIDGVNRYTYALNAPVNFTDPMGLAAVGSVGGTARGVSSASTGGNGWLGWLQGGLDVVGAGAEYVLPGPGTAIGTLADVASAGISWWQGDNLSASASLAAALPYVGSVALIAKASRQVDGVVGVPKGALGPRVDAVHGALHPIAQTRRTTAGLDTAEGARILSAGGRDLSPAQRAALAQGETAASLPGAHAEVTALEHAAANGLTPAQMSVSRPICPACAARIEQSGGRLTSPTTAEWP